MDRKAVRRFALLMLLTAALFGCGRMQPMGSNEDLIKYTVREGETLYSISWRFGYDYREVAAWNHIPPPYNIYPGQLIYIIPPYQREAKPPRQASATDTSSPGVPTAPGRTQEPVPQSATVTASRTRPVTMPSPARRVEKRPPSHQQKVIGWRWPTTGIIIAGFSPGNGKKGLDIRGKLGQSVTAAADGNVVYSGNGLIGYGNLVIIKHDETYLSAYGHNRRLLVKEGETVKQGDKIAEMGDSGKDGVILHFEIRRDGKPVNPLSYLPKQRN